MVLLEDNSMQSMNGIYSETKSEDTLPDIAQGPQLFSGSLVQKDSMRLE